MADVWANFIKEVNDVGFDEIEVAALEPSQVRPFAERLHFHEEDELKAIEKGCADLREKHPNPYGDAQPSKDTALGLSLPQDDSIAAQRMRKKQIEDARVQYRTAYAGTTVPPFIGQPLPKEERDKNDLTRIVQILMDGLRETGEVYMNATLDWFGDIFREEDPWKDFADILEEKPAVIKTWKDDHEFARQRLNAIHPQVIERCTKLPEGFPVTEDIVKGLIPDDTTLEAEMAAGRVYLCDYGLMEGLPAPTEYNCLAPFSLFHVNREGKLMPLAIQLGQKPGPEFPIYTPKDAPGLWLAVKIHCQCADIGLHESISHLFKTHLVSESLYVSARRNMSTAHPLIELLKPHMFFTLLLNDLGRKTLIAKGGAIVRALSPGFDGTYELFARAYRQLTLTELDFPRKLERRGVHDAEKLPNFYYREDGLAVWHEIETYVTELMAKFYDSDDAILKDWELQAWIADIQADQGLNFKGLPVGEDGVMRTRAELSHFMTMIIFNVSAEHAAVNNGQYDYFSFLPNIPGIFTLPKPTGRDDIPEVELAKHMPSLCMGAKIISTVHQLSKNVEAIKSQEALGQYEPSFMKDRSDVQPVIDKFKLRLKAVSERIQERNRNLVAKGEVPYPYLDPAQVAQGISS